MNPLSIPSTLLKAVTFPFKFMFVIGLCYFINWMTSPNQWWAQWVAFGMGIAWIAIWARALKALALTALATALAYLAHRFIQRAK